ncbi:hypothetical protein BDY21DRAFT_331974 [Lineolata rhizophorae]|uniref:Uncharacterized protein n=1 Tax=Lineolata rhizophorae TaxID=578093 RepID=A0A6A6PDA4_9PEZI|nr:hypothetical protein BDY21DRAFT_331974 [Lineolata rhizophorae]
MICLFLFCAFCAGAAVCVALVFWRARVEGEETWRELSIDPVLRLAKTFASTSPFVVVLVGWLAGAEGQTDRQRGVRCGRLTCGSGIEESCGKCDYR